MKKGEWPPLFTHASVEARDLSEILLVDAAAPMLGVVDELLVPQKPR